MVKTDTATQERIERLLSGGSDHGRGGINVTALFRPILEHVLDHGPSTLDELTKAVQTDSFMSAKGTLLRSIYSDPWRGATLDGVEQLRSVQLLDLEANRWKLTDNFRVGKSQIVIRKDQRGGQPAITLAIASKAQRDATGDEFEKRAASNEQRAKFKRAAEELHPSRPGLRPISKTRVAELVDSIHAIGYVKDSKIYRDQHGRILDGRHRLEAVKQAGIALSDATHVREVRVESDQEALEWAWHLNKGQKTWTTEDVKYITRLLGGQHPDDVLSGWNERERIAAREILTDPERTDQDIADVTGVSRPTVTRARKKLITAGQAVDRSPAKEKRERIEQAIEEYPEATDYAVAQQLGVSQHTVKAARADLHSGSPVNQDAVVPPPPATPEAAPKAPPSRQNWTIGWVGDYSEAPKKIVRKLLREPDIARETLRLLREALDDA